MNKKDLRKSYKQIRLSIENKEKKSNIIFDKIKKEIELDDFNVIALYSNLEDEVSTSQIIEYFISQNKKVVLPRITNKNQLDFYYINSIKELEKNKFGILEPVASLSNLVKKEDIDIFIIPGICFDLEKNRIGFGKGFYDYYLENAKGKKVGICFDEQIIDQIIEVNQFDVKMDFVISDKRIIR